MAINYNAGFLPQGLYSNLSNIMQQGIDQEANRRKARWEGMQGLAGSFAQSARTQAADAKAAYKADYEEQKARLQERMKEIDPRDVETMKAFDQRLNFLDQQYKDNLQNFDKSGFLGSVLGKDYENLAKQQTAMGQLGMPEIDPAGTRLARKLEDDAALYQNKKTIDYEMDPQTAAATKTAELQAGAEFAQSDLGQSVQTTEDQRRLEVRKKELELEAEAYIKRNGGSNKEVEMAIQKIRSAPNLEELNQRLLLQKQEFDNRMKLLGKENEYNLAEIEARRGADLETIGARQTKPAKPGDPYKYLGALNSQVKSIMDVEYPNAMPTEITPEIRRDIEDRARKRLMEFGIYPPGYNAEFSGGSGTESSRAGRNEDINAPVAPSMRDLGFEATPGQGFISQNFLNGLDAQTTDLGNRVERLQNDSGRPMFPELQKRADQLMVRADQANMKMMKAKTPEEQMAVREELSSISKEIFQVANELDQKEMNSGSFRGTLRKFGQSLGL